MAIGVMLIAQPASRIYRFVGPRRMIGLGILSMGITTLALMYVELDTNLWTIRAIMIARGLGFGFVLVPLQAATYATVAPADTGRATALYNAASQVASSFGVAVGATALTSRLSDRGAALGPFTPGPAIDAFQDVFLLIGLLTLAGAAVALLISDRAAAATMAPKVAEVSDAEKRDVAPIGHP
jgi:MFS family permease